MATKRVKGQSFTSHIGALRFPKLSQVDLGTDEYPAPDGVYSANLIVTLADSDTQTLIAKLTPLYERALQSGQEAFAKLPVANRKKLGEFKANPLFTEIYGDDEEPTGDAFFSFKMRASGKYAKGKNQGRYWDSRPPVFNRKGELLVPGFNFRLREETEELRDVHKLVRPDIYGGTTAKVSFAIGVDRETGEPGYFVTGTGMGGLKLGLQAVQVFDIVSGGGRDAAGYGFSAEADEDADTNPLEDANTDF